MKPMNWIEFELFRLWLRVVILFRDQFGWTGSVAESAAALLVAGMAGVTFGVMIWFPVAMVMALFDRQPTE